jgi:methylenetetrahydrofolate dehydrogenase (NADP+) / methenyltetrahydrofolate cyclohydrolase
VRKSWYYFKSFKADLIVKMVAQVIDGVTIADSICKNIKSEILQRKQQGLRTPGLAVILVGEDPASEIYVKNKIAKSIEVGIISKSFSLKKETSQPELISLINTLNRDPEVDGILLQLPLPSHIDQNAILALINPDKDVDGFHPFNVGRLAQGFPYLRSCTPFGIMRLLEHTKVKLKGSSAVIVGASNIVGRPMAFELLNAECTVTVCHKYTKNLSDLVKIADILIVATGNPKLIPGEWVKPGAVVIDVGINRLPNGKLEGDVDFTGAKEVAAWITPVPGGVGPMTIAMLLFNTLLANKKADKKLKSQLEL